MSSPGFISLATAVSGEQDHTPAHRSGSIGLPVTERPERQSKPETLLLKTPDFRLWTALDRSSA